MSSWWCLRVLAVLLLIGGCVEQSSPDPPVEEYSALSRPPSTICGTEDAPEGWICVPPGEFQLGAGGCYGSGNAGGATGVQVALSRPFWAADQAVSGEDWHALMAEYTDTARTDDNTDSAYDSVRYGAALLYANRLSESEGYSPCYTVGPDVGCRPFGIGEGFVDFDCEPSATPLYDPTCTGYRLPTIAENEWVLRAAGQFDWPEMATCRDHPWFDGTCQTVVSLWVFDRTTRMAPEFGTIDYFPPGEYADPVLHEVLGEPAGIPLSWLGLRRRNVCNDITALGESLGPYGSGLRLVRTATETLSEQPVR
jgi:hypothetical protein